MLRVRAAALLLRLKVPSSGALGNCNLVRQPGSPSVSLCVCVCGQWSHLAVVIERGERVTHSFCDGTAVCLSALVHLGVAADFMLLFQLDLPSISATSSAQAIALTLLSVHALFNCFLQLVNVVFFTL